MRIVKFQSENVKRLKAVEIVPENDVVIISGKNGQGKTSVLDSIWLALGGATAVKETKTDRPIRDGAEKAKVVLDLGDLEVTRTWTSNDQSYLKIKGLYGEKITSPQVLLDKLMGRLSFDPLAFSKMSDKDQLKTLLELVELPIDPVALDNKKKEIYDQRTLVNRDIKQLDGQLKGLAAPAENLPDKELSMDEVLAELDAARETKRINDEKRSQLAKKQTACVEVSNLVKNLKAELEKAQNEYDTIVAEGKALRTEVDQLVDPDIDSCTEKLRQMDAINRNIRDAVKYREIETKLSLCQITSEDLTAQIADIDERREKAIKEAKMPIEGLGFSDDGVEFKDVPFGQCSDAEKLRVSIAMAMALNPEIRVIRITNGSLLDSNSMRIIEEMAQAKDYQVWIEVVDESGELGIVIEDGQVKETLPKSVETTGGFTGEFYNLGGGELEN